MDALYYTTDITAGGADLWADDPGLNIPGRSHVSVNDPHVYVDIPASLQAYKPIENILATDQTKEARAAATNKERVYTAWKGDEQFELTFHKASTVKGLYGETAGFIYYDREKGHPCAKVVQNPRNLWMGYKSDEYLELEWAAYVTLMDPNAVRESYGVEFTVRSASGSSALGAPTGDGEMMPWCIGNQIADQPRPNYNYGPARVEVWDYWYRKPAAKRGRRGQQRMETWNVVVAGNAVVSGPYKYAEYKGRIPYVPLFNTFIPGTPTGRADLHDLEQLLREKMQRITSGSQAIAGATAGDFWQLVGPDAPAQARSPIKPVRNVVVYPGAGNRIESITPFVAQFQLEQYLGRIDREMSVISGLNELLLGLAPAQVLSSSKAINALIANYESRLAMRRLLFYTWRRDMWELAWMVWASKDTRIKQIEDAGGGFLEIIDPSLSPRDEGDTAIRAGNLVSAKLISQARGMDMVGVDDPEAEQDIIREESTDATLWPERVQIMAQLLIALGQAGIQAPAGAVGQAQGQANSATGDLRNALGAGTPQVGPGAPASAADLGQTPPIPGQPQTSGGAPAPFIQGPNAGGGTQLQSMTEGGQVHSRIISKTNLGRR
jgi:hypothetical protein